MHCVLIDPETRVVKNVDVDLSLEMIYELLDVQSVDIVRMGACSFYVDDNGLFRPRDENG